VLVSVSIHLGTLFFLCFICLTLFSCELSFMSVFLLSTFYPLLHLPVFLSWFTCVGVVVLLFSINYQALTYFLNG